MHLVVLSLFLALLPIEVEGSEIIIKEWEIPTPDSDTVTITVHVVDPADVDNKAQITKEFEHSFKYKEQS